MTLKLIAGPTVEPVSLVEAKAHLRVTDSNSDITIISLLLSARQHIDGQAGWLGRALCTQTWELRLDRFSDGMEVPLPPLQSITSIKYIDPDGVEQTLSTDVYTTTNEEPARIVRKYGESWPSTRSEHEAVRIVFVAGYGVAAAVPETLKTALKFHVESYYDRDERKAALLREARDSLLGLYKVWP